MCRKLASMGRLILFPAVAFGVSWASTAWNKPSIQADEPKSDPSRRRVDFQMTNVTDVGPAGWLHIRGKRSLPIRARVADIGGFRQPREVRIFVAIYERPDPNSLVKGPLVKFVAADGAMKTPAVGDNEQPCRMDIPLRPGQYLFYLFACDPTFPSMESHERLAEDFGEVVAAGLPGVILRGQLGSAEVLP